MKEFSGSDLSRSEPAYLKVALALAETSTCRMRHGAVIVSGGRVMAFGINRERNAATIFQDTHGIPENLTVHAEVSALNRVKGSLTGSTIYIGRVLKNGKPALSRPCDACWKTLNRRGIRKVVFSISK